MLNHPEKYSSIYPLNQQDKGYPTNMTLETVLKHGILLDRRQQSYDFIQVDLILF